MSDDIVQQFESLCIDNDPGSINQLLNSIGKNSIPLSDLLTMVTRCLDICYWNEAVALFEKALLVNVNLTNELTQILNHKNLSNAIHVKTQLLNAAAKAQRDYSQLLLIGLLYRDHEIFSSAENIFLQLIEHNPKDIRAFHRLISVYCRMLRFHDAIACCRLALEIDSNSLTAHYNLGVANMSLNRDSEAFSNFTTAINIDPKNQWAHINIAKIMLKQGAFEKGWRQFEWRRAFYEKKHNDLAAVYPEWTEQPLSGKSILVWADQGLGDIIMFAGLIGPLLTLNCCVSIMAEERLENLFKRSFPIANFYPLLISPEQQKSHSIDYQIPFCSLGARFIHDFSDFERISNQSSLRNNDINSGYLVADSYRAKTLTAFFEKHYNKKFKIGFSWRGGLVDTGKFSRNIPLALWKSLLERNDSIFINLQYDSSNDERLTIEQMGGINQDLDLRQDIDELASLLTSIDLLISIDNSSAHLAGALGVPVWNLLPFSDEWRWFLEKKKSYWYPSMRLFRQSEIGHWESVLIEIDEALSEFIDDFVE